MYRVSRKTQRSIRLIGERIVAGQFDEQDVKLLLIDLREVAKSMSKNAEAPDEVRGMAKAFNDYCDFIAHPSRDRGEVWISLRTHLTSFIQAHKDRDAAAYWRPIEIGVLPELLCHGVYFTALEALRGYDDQFTGQLLKAIDHRRSEFILCFMSILQDVQIDLKGGDHGILHMLVHEGSYRVYCAVFSQPLQGEQKEAGLPVSSFFGFPVMVSSVPDVDGACNRTDMEPLVLGQLPPLVETYRSTDGRLAVRRIP